MALCYLYFKCILFSQEQVAKLVFLVPMVLRNDAIPNNHFKNTANRVTLGLINQ